MSVADTLLHVDEDLDLSARERIVENIRNIPGVISPRFNPGKEHLLLVAFDPSEIQSRGLLENIRNQGYHAELIGL
jgi:hypothetical protein